MIGKSRTEFDMNLAKFIERFTKDAPTVIQCPTCDNREELSGEITTQTLLDDNWLLEPVVYCPRCGEDDDDKGGR